jgi:uncharacterized Tic20 family protein
MSATPPPPVNPYATPPQPMSPGDEKTWSILVHLGGIFLAWLAPLVGYLALKDRGPFVRAHVVTALNFQLTLLIAYVVGVVSSLFIVGILVILAAAVLGIVFSIMAAVAASNGQYYKYPMSIEFVR